VRYKSYAGFDDALAKIWVYKYLLKSGLGYKSAILNLTHAGIDLKMQNYTGGSSKAQRMRMIVNTQDYIEKTKSEYKGDTSSYCHWACYLDIEKDIAYVAFMFTPLNQKSGSCFGGWTITSADQLWKNVVFRVHNPKVIPVSEMSDHYSKMKEYAHESGVSQAIDFSHANQVVSYHLVKNNMEYAGNSNNCSNEYIIVFIIKLSGIYHVYMHQCSI